MMSDKYSMNNRDEMLQAYLWAEKEMNSMFPHPDNFRIKNLKNRREKPNTHVSLFRGYSTDEVIVRVYWADSNRVKYSRVANYPELREESSDLVDLLERNGLYIYEQALAHTQALAS